MTEIYAELKQENSLAAMLALRAAIAHLRAKRRSFQLPSPSFQNDFGLSKYRSNRTYADKPFSEQSYAGWKRAYMYNVFARLKVNFHSH